MHKNLELNAKKVSEMINSNEIINYNNHKYTVVGYQVLKKNNQKLVSIGLQELNVDCILWVNINNNKLSLIKDQEEEC